MTRGSISTHCIPSQEMKLFVVLTICLVVSNAFTSAQLTEWDLFKALHGKNYDDTEDGMRFNIYLAAKKNISEHNEKYRNGEVSYYLGVNKFTDMFEYEVTALNGAKGDGVKTGQAYLDNVDNDTVPETLDWREFGVVTAVKDQKDCGSCWAFSATGSLEGQYALATGNLVSFSEQNLIDCSYAFNNKGCLHGMPDRAFNYIQKNGGIDTELSYPYLNKVGKCKYLSQNKGTTVKGHVDLPAGNETTLRNAVATIGPISVCIDATKQSFHRYAGGIYDDSLCSNKTFDHCVLAVGYGSENGRDYWLIKNSWGPHWGQNGYIKMLRNGDNLCGVANHASFPLV